MVLGVLVCICLSVCLMDVIHFRSVVLSVGVL